MRWILPTFFLFAFNASALVTMDTSAPVKRFIYTIQECESLNDSSLAKDCRAQFPPSGKFANPNEHLTLEDVPDDSVRAPSKPVNYLGRPQAPVVPEVPKSAGDCLVSAGTHSLISLGLGVAGTGLILISGSKHPVWPLSLVLFAGAVGFSIAVPIDLIMAGYAMNGTK